MWSRRLKDIFAAITIGDGTVGLIVLREHSLLPAGPQGARKAAHFFAGKPNYMSLLGLAQTSFGVRLALSQYREE